MRTLLGTLMVAGLVGLAACQDTNALTGPASPTGPSFTRQSNSATPEVPAGKRPQPNPNKSKRSH